MLNETSNQTLEQFVDRLLAEKKLNNLEPEILAEARRDLLEKAEDRVKAAILENLPADKTEEFINLMESQDAAKLQEFVKETIPNLEGVIAQALLSFRHSYLA